MQVHSWWLWNTASLETSQHIYGARGVNLSHTRCSIMVYLVFFLHTQFFCFLGRMSWQFLWMLAIQCFSWEWEMTKTSEVIWSFPWPLKCCYFVIVSLKCAKELGFQYFPWQIVLHLAVSVRKFFSDYQPEFFPFLVRLQTTLNNCTPCLEYISIISIDIFYRVILSTFPLPHCWARLPVFCALIHVV